MEAVSAVKETDEKKSKASDLAIKAAMEVRVWGEKEGEGGATRRSKRCDHVLVNVCPQY